MSLLRMFDCMPKRLLLCVHIWPKLTHYLRRYLAIFLEGFTQFLVVEFKEIHKLFNTANKVRQMRVVNEKRGSKTTLAAVQKLCSKANDVFHSLNMTNQWNISQGHRVDAFGKVCYNCGALDHASN